MCISKLKDWFLELKTMRNCRYIEKNSKTILKKIKNDVKNRKLRVAFLCNDASKWKCMSLFNLLNEDKNFEPFILVTKNCCNEDNTSAMSDEKIIDTFDFFQSQNMPVQYAYDIKNKKHMPLEKFKPDVIFYQQPWYIETSQGPVVTSKYALSYYVPYFVATSLSPVEYYLRFHRYVHAHYVFDENTKNHFSSCMKNNGKNLRVSGHPMLDYFYLNKDKNESCEKKYVIYAPHWSITKDNKLNWGTFKENGKLILEFAKSHPEIDWVFKPHPNLKKTLLLEASPASLHPALVAGSVMKSDKEQSRADKPTSSEIPKQVRDNDMFYDNTSDSHTRNVFSNIFISEEEIENYWNEWAKIGIVHETGGYLEIFEKAHAMITDSGSFLTEFFMIAQPLIHLTNPNAVHYNHALEAINKNYYEARNNDELTQLLEKIILNAEDPMKEQRRQALKSSNYLKNYAAKNIIEDLRKEFEIS